jgi:hypothetical protein
MEFQLFLCGRGPELVDFVASVVPDEPESDERIVEVRYRPDLGRVVSLLARRLVPKLSFWFDIDTHSWIGHRLPLYSKGPEVFVVREGVPTGWISSQ